MQKKLDPSILKIDFAIANLSLGKKFEFFFKFWEIFLARKIAITQAIFWVPLNFFSIWSLVSPFNYEFINNASTSPRKVPKAENSFGE